MMTSSDPLIQYFHCCWPSLLNESKDCNAMFFEEKDFKIEDSRDADFSKTEIRLAYMNKFGQINAGLVEKCASDFFEQYFLEDKNYFSENLKICSLSNGPGIDIFGFLLALYKTKQPKCIPVLQAISVNRPWQDAYQNLMTSAYRAYNSKFPETVFPDENIKFMECDIFSNLSPEAQNSINSCDILLMLKVFSSSKATLEIFLGAMQKIFSLLKPGALVFFFGSKKNFKEIFNRDDLKKYVNCSFGPAEIELQKFSPYEIISKVVSVKPNLYPKVKFCVFQKKDISGKADMDSLQNVSKSKKKRAKRKKKAIVDTNPNGLPLDITTHNSEKSYSDSESSYTSNSKQSDTLSIQSQSLLHENKFQSAPSQYSNNRNCADGKNHPLNVPTEITPVFDKFISHIGIAENGVSKDNTEINLSSHRKQSNLPAKPSKNHSMDDSLAFIMEMTSKEKILPCSFPRADLSQSPKLIACKELRMEDASNHRTKLMEISQKKNCSYQMNCSNYNREEKGVQTSDTLKQSKLPAQEQYQFNNKNTFTEHIPVSTKKDELSSMLQRCETLVASLERVVAAFSSDMQSLQNSEVSMKECCSRHDCSAIRNVHCCMHYGNVFSHSCCRKMCDCMRTQCNFDFAHSNCICFSRHTTKAHMSQ